MSHHLPTPDDTQIDPIALLGRTRVIAYRPDVSEAIGDTIAGLLLQQLWWWTNHKDRVLDDHNPKLREGEFGEWLAPNQQIIKAATGISRSSQETARRLLRDLGVLYEARRGTPARIWYRVDKARLRDILLSSIGCDSCEETGKPARFQQTCEPDSYKQDGGFVADKTAELVQPIRRSRARSENLRENKGETTAAPTGTTNVVDSSTIEVSGESEDEVHTMLADMFGPRLEPKAEIEPASSPAKCFISATLPTVSFAADPLYRTMVDDYDVSPSRARSLLTMPREDGKGPREVCERQVSWFPHRPSPRHPDAPGGYLCRTIEDDWRMPPAVRKVEKRREVQRQQRESDARAKGERLRAEQAEAEQQIRRDQVLAALTDKEADALDDAALAACAAKCHPLSEAVRQWQESGRNDHEMPVILSGVYRVERRRLLDDRAEAATWVEGRPYWNTGEAFRKREMT